MEEGAFSLKAKSGNTRYALKYAASRNKTARKLPDLLQAHYSTARAARRLRAYAAMQRYVMLYKRNKNMDIHCEMNTSGGQGYSLEQLLAWSIEDRLIDGFEKEGEVIILVKGKLRKAFPFHEARNYLKRMFRQLASERALAAAASQNQNARPVRVSLMGRRQAS